MSYFEEYDPYTGERSSFGGIAEAAAEYHLRGEPCPWDCYRCDPADAYYGDEEPLPVVEEPAQILLEEPPF